MPVEAEFRKRKLPCMRGETEFHLARFSESSSALSRRLPAEFRSAAKVRRFKSGQGSPQCLAEVSGCDSNFLTGKGVTINLAPADVRKEGSGFDLPMALGLVGCQGQFFGKQLDKMMFLGELSLDGSVRSVRGALSAALAAREFGLKSLAVPEANAKEAAVVEGVDVYALKSLPQAVDLVNSPESFTPVKVDAQYSVDLRDVHGQQAAKRALGVACAGGH